MNTLQLTKKYTPFSLFKNLDSFFESDFLANSIWHSYKSNLFLADWQENDKNYFLEIELPRYEAKEIKVTVENGYLKINAEHKTKNNVYSINRAYSLPADAGENYSAKLERGVLTVSLEKRTVAKPKQINVEVK